MCECFLKLQAPLTSSPQRQLVGLWVGLQTAPNWLNQQVLCMDFKKLTMPSFYSWNKVDGGQLLSLFQS